MLKGCDYLSGIVRALRVYEGFRLIGHPILSVSPGRAWLVGSRGDSGTRERLLAAVQARIKRFAEFRDAGAVLDPRALSEVEALLGAARSAIFFLKWSGFCTQWYVPDLR